MNRVWNILRDSVKGFIRDDCFSSGAAVAFYAVFSLPSLFVIILSVGQMFGVSQERLGRIAESQAGLPLLKSFEAADPESGPDAKLKPDRGESTTVQTAAESAPGTHRIRRTVGVVIWLFSATVILAQLQYSLNRAWEVEPDPDHGGIKNFLLKRVISLGLILVIAFLLLVSLALTTLIDEFGEYLRGSGPTQLAKTVGRILNELVAFSLATGLFAAMYKILPDAEMKWSDVLAGAAITAALSTVGRLVLSWYLSTANVASGWDQAAQSVVIVLVWVYYSSLIVLFGAEVSRAWVDSSGGKAQPSAGAVRTVRDKKHVRT